MILTELLNAELFARGDYTDINIQAFGHSYPLHRVILGTNEYFRRVMVDKTHIDSHGVHLLEFPTWVNQLAFEVSLLHIYGLPTEKHEYEILIQFGYHGLCALLATAHLLNLAQLRRFIVRKLVAFVTVENAPDIATEFSRHKGRYAPEDVQVLLSTCTDAATSRGSSLPIEYWYRYVLAPNLVMQIFQSDALYIANEWDRFNYLHQVYEYCSKQASGSSGASKTTIVKSPNPSLYNFDPTQQSSIHGKDQQDQQTSWVRLAKRLKWSVYSAKKLPTSPGAANNGETQVETEAHRKEIKEGHAKLMDAILCALNEIRFIYFNNDQLEFSHTLNMENSSLHLVRRARLENGLWLRMMLRQKLLSCTTYSPPHINIESFSEYPSYHVLGAQEKVVSQYPAVRFSSSFTLQEVRRATTDVHARRGITIHYAGSTWTLILARVKKHFPDMCIRLAREGNAELKESPTDTSTSSNRDDCPTAETYDQRQRTCARFQVTVSYLPTEEEGERIWREHFGGAVAERLPLTTHYFTLNSVQEDSWQQVPCVERFVKSKLLGSLRFSVALTLL